MDDNISIYTNKEGRTRVYLKDKMRWILRSYATA